MNFLTAIFFAAAIFFTGLNSAAAAESETEKNKSANQLPVSIWKNPDTLISRTTLIRTKSDSSFSTIPKNRFDYGYGVFGVYFLLPVPFAEGSIHLGKLDLRGNFALNFGYLDVRAELAILGNQKKGGFDFIINSGYCQAVQSGKFHCWGIGFDVRSKKARRFYRCEFGMTKRTGHKKWRFLPRIAIGWR